MRLSTRSMLKVGDVSSAVVDHAPQPPEDIDQRAGDNAEAKGLNDVEEAFHGGASGYNRLPFIAKIRGL